MGKPVVAIIGRQNVGKSTLLNRMAGKPIAIVEDLPGTTRDRVMASVSWQGTEFTVVDTGGLELRPESTIGQEVREQAEVAIAEADVVIFLVDVKDGVVKLKLRGACGTCPMAAMTLKHGVEQVLKQNVPGVKEVIAV